MLKIKLLLTLFLLLVPVKSFAYECSAELDALSRRTGVPIYCSIESFGGLDKSINGENPPQRLIDRVSPVIHRFFDIYGNEFISKRTDAIILLENLKFMGEDVGGLSNGRNIYVCLDDYGNREYTEMAYFKIINHEFSSNIYKRASLFKRLTWSRFSSLYKNTKEYLIKCLKNYQFSILTNEEILTDGLINYYSLTSEENDFNLYAEKMFSNGSEMARLKRNYSKINLKLEFVKSLYRDAGYRGRFPDEP